MTKPGLVVSLDGVNELATAWAEEHAGELIQTEEEIREWISLLVSEANATGRTVDQLAVAIREGIGLTGRQVAAVSTFRDRLLEQGLSMGRIATRTARYAEAQLRARAINIARTEMQAALNGGQQALWDEAVEQGVIESEEFLKTWLTAPDDRLCPICEELEGAFDTRLHILRNLLGQGTHGGSQHPPERWHRRFRRRRDQPRLHHLAPRRRWHLPSLHLPE